MNNFLSLLPLDKYHVRYPKGTIYKHFKTQQLQFFLVTSQLLVFDSSFCCYKTFLNDCVFPYFGKDIWSWVDWFYPAFSAAWRDKKLFIYLLVCLGFFFLIETVECSFLFFSFLLLHIECFLILKKITKNISLLNSNILWKIIFIDSFTLPKDSKILWTSIIQIVGNRIITLRSDTLESIFPLTKKLKTL